MSGLLGDHREEMKMDQLQWIGRCAQQFQKRAKLTPQQAMYFAGIAANEMLDDFPDDPEGAADEEMSSWTDDGDDPE